MYYLYALTGLGLILSFFASRDKTIRAIKIAVRKFTSILPTFTIMLIFVSIVLFFLPDKVISALLMGDNTYASAMLAAVIGTVAIMPGFLVFPLCGILLSKGVPYMVLSAFTTTLMMVGILTYPIEKAYFGTRVAILRNTVSFFIALVVAVMTGLFFGELL